VGFVDGLEVVKGGEKHFNFFVFQELEQKLLEARLVIYNDIIGVVKYNQNFLLDRPNLLQDPIQYFM
jgi:hypothetical protein